MLADARLRDGTVAAAAAAVAAHAGVRAALLRLQQDFAAGPRGAVLDGRDIGTLIAPRAEAKLFVTAAPEVRARRRHAELHAAGDRRTIDEVLADIRARDARDAGRAVAPLLQAADAVRLDTTALDVAAAIAVAVAVVEARLAGTFATPASGEATPLDR